MTLREFEATFRKLYVPLGMYALRMVDDVDDAEDIVQDAFIAAWEKLRQGSEVANMKAYMYMAVRNGAIAFLRSRREAVGIDSIGDVTADDVDTSERDARIWQAIDRLPARCREIFLMSKRDGMSNEQIADELDLSLQTVKNQISRAYKSLREALGDGHKPFFLPFL